MPKKIEQHECKCGETRPFKFKDRRKTKCTACINQENREKTKHKKHGNCNRERRALTPAQIEIANMPCTNERGAQLREMIDKRVY